MATPPQYCPNPRELDDLSLLTQGAFGANPRFGGSLTLHIPRDVETQTRSSHKIELIDPEGAPLATVTIERACEDAGDMQVFGPVVPAGQQEFGTFRRLYIGPDQTRVLGHDVLTVPVAGPLTDRDLSLIRANAKDRLVLLLALVGHGTPSYAGRPMSATGLIRATLAGAQLLDRARVVAVPLASRGPGRKDEDDLLGRRVVEAYAPGDVLTVPGDGELPESVRQIVEFELPPRQAQGLVLLFTGLSGSGKSTLARALHDVILERGERTITSLDGDVVRRNLSAGLTFSRADREINIRRIGWVAAEISRHRGVAICSPIAPFDETRQQVRTIVEEAGGAFFLIHVATPVEECERRDRKGLYAKARRGEIPEFTGISSPYEVPQDADVRVDTTGRTIEDALSDILEALDDSGYLPMKADT